ncbi:MAG: hypothetical protein AB7O73_15815, partial [Bacteroidia bacterium]
SGIKIYPALGYFPFDIRLKEIYEYALEKEIPILTHCIRGTVYFRGNKGVAFNNEKYHPFRKCQIPLYGRKPKDFTLNFTHPLNYECLLNQEVLSDIWGMTAPDFRKLELCLGHYGGDDEWVKYLTDPWLPSSYTTNKSWTPLKLNGPWFHEHKSNNFNQKKPYSWFSICNELMFKYENVYSDISYIISNPEVYPMIKMLLTTGYYKDIKHKILFGTDYFVVSKEGSDRELSIKLRAFIGEDLYKTIAHDNPSKFLRNSLN